MTSRVAIVIPVYKKATSLSINEVALLDQAKKVFSNRSLFLFGPSSLFANSDKDQRFDSVAFRDEFFHDKLSYSKLLCSQEFYQAFASFDYIQIVQTDCWLFEDRLDEFMGMGFDYIGAPWMKNGFSGKPQKELWKVGNGGFSLRKTRSFISILKQIESDEKGGVPVFRDSGNILTRQFKNRGIRNSLRHYLKKPPGEDIFWAHYIPKVFDDEEFKIADPVTGAHYAFEVFPEFLFNKITKGKLPLGCHNWENNNPAFWEAYIRSNFPSE